MGALTLLQDRDIPIIVSPERISALTYNICARSAHPYLVVDALRREIVRYQETYPDMSDRTWQYTEALRMLRPDSSIEDIITPKELRRLVIISAMADILGDFPFQRNPCLRMHHGEECTRYTCYFVRNPMFPVEDRDDNVDVENN